MPDSPDAFGFASLPSVKDRIRQIRPNSPTAAPDLERIDAVADQAGFVSREAATDEPYAYRGSRYQKPEPRIPLNMRVPVSLGAAFQGFCEQERYSYPEGLAEIMRRAGLTSK